MNGRHISFEFANDLIEESKRAINPATLKERIKYLCQTARRRPRLQSKKQAVRPATVAPVLEALAAIGQVRWLPDGRYTG